ncbi:MAG TPA: glycosyl hydrolase family 28-related protein [Thermohalobaculum sp.]|nr:glycosyl hydrolase family 28-related protein [Thermohalobaculum sp.]
MSTRRQALLGLLGGVAAGSAAAQTPGADAGRAPEQVARLPATGDIATHGFAEPVRLVATEGHAWPGDGGGGLYERAAFEPAHAGRVRSADGVWWELVSDRLNVRQFGARGDGLTDDTAAIQAGIARVEERGGGTLGLPAGRYVVSAPLRIAEGGVHLEGEGPARTILTKRQSTRFVIAEGRWDTDGVPLAADALQGESALALPPGAGAGVAADSWTVLVSEAPAEGGPSVRNLQAEFVHVHAVAGDRLTLSAPLRHDYLTVEAAELRTVAFIDGLRLSGIGFDGNGHIEGANPNEDNAVELDWCLRPVIEDCAAWELPNVFVKLENCLEARLTGLRARDLLSGGILGAERNYGYAIVEVSLNEGLIADQIHGERVRHVYTTAANGVQYGVPTGSRITNGVAIRCRGSGWDTHPEGADIGFVNCVVLGSLGSGFQLRSVGAGISGCSARDCLGAALNLSRDSMRCRVSGLDAHQTNLGVFNDRDWFDRGAIHDDGRGNVVDGATVTRCGGPVLEVAGNADGGVYRNVLGRDPCRVTETMRRGFVAHQDGPRGFELRDMDIVDTAGRMAEGYFLTAGTLTRVRLVGCEARGFSGDQFAIAGGIGVQVFSSAGVFAGALGSRTRLRVEGGAISVEAASSAFIALDTGGGTAALDTIDGAEEGARITLVRGDGAVAIRHGAGNIFLSDGADALLAAPRDNLTLIRIGGSWAEAGRGIA